MEPVLEDNDPDVPGRTPHDDSVSDAHFGHSEAGLREF